METTVTLLNTDCFEAFKTLEDESVDAVITDPPYFLDKLGDSWDTNTIKHKTKKTTVTSLPVGMKFDKQQGQQFQKFMQQVAVESFRILKPGGFFLAMSAPRLYHRLGVGVEDAGFEIRDMWSWIYTQNQVKAMSLARFVDESTLSPEQYAILEQELSEWKTPQVKSCLEPIVFAQKPKTDEEGKPVTFLANWLSHHVGLVNVKTNVGMDQDMTTANVITTGPINSALDKAFLVPKPSKSEKGDTTHISVKPLALMDQLIRATVPVGGLVLDPFNGSGTTGISAIRLNRSYIGFELNPLYYEQSKERFLEIFREEKFYWELCSLGVKGKLA